MFHVGHTCTMYTMPLFTNLFQSTLSLAQYTVEWKALESIQERTVL